MNKQHIQDLLDKYFEGETSLEEEVELKKFFHKTALIPEEWKSYKQLFTYFETEVRKTMPDKEVKNKKKNIFWLVGVGISLAASVLILLTVFIPPTTTQLEPLATAIKHPDTFYANNKGQAKKSDTAKSAKPDTKKQEKTRPVPIKKILEDDSSTILADGIAKKSNRSSLNNTINDALAPLDRMKDFDQALDKFKYFDLMNKYLPGQDLSKMIHSNN